MKKNILLTIWIVIIFNSLFFLWIYFFKDNFTFVGDNNNVILQKEKKVITQHITENYDIKDVQSKIVSTIKNVSNSVVSIVISKDLEVYYFADPFAQKAYVEKKKRKIGWWSGIIISKDGYILTNKHVIADLDADYSVVTKNGDVYKVDKVRTDPILDLAVLHVVDEKWQPVYDLQPANIIDANSPVQIWQFVIAIWNALAEYSDTVTLWILSAKWRKLEENNGSLYVWLYQTDAAINPWNSGGPLIDIAWQVIGVNTAITAQGQWIWFSIPINRQFIKATLESIEKYHTIKRPLLGVKIISINKTLAKKLKLSTYEWVLVQEVLPNSPAFFAWIKKWDIILKIDWKTINKDNPIIYSVFTHSLWDEINLIISRNWKLISKKLKLTEF